MKPYYEKDGITIYHGDCREVLPTLGPIDLVLTDPPYGISFDFTVNRFRPGLNRDDKSAFAAHDKQWTENVAGDTEPFDPSPFLKFPTVILWGAQNYSDKLPSSRGWLVWDKLAGKTPCDFGDCELAWTNIDMPVRIHQQLWRGVCRSGEENAVNGRKLHPCQKPLALMGWCIGFARLSTGSLILDPFMGSGTTLRAAKDSGYRAIGIEIEERYCEIAAKRLSQGVFDFGEPLTKV